MHKIGTVEAEEVNAVAEDSGDKRDRRGWLRQRDRRWPAGSGMGLVAVRPGGVSGHRRARAVGGLGRPGSVLPQLGGGLAVSARSRAAATGGPNARPPGVAST